MVGRVGRALLRSGFGQVAALVVLLLAGCAGGPKTLEAEGPLVWPAPPEQPRFFYEQTITGSSDIVVESSADRLRRIATGESTRGKGFEKPFGVAAVNGRVYVGDTVGRKVAIYDLAAKRYSEIGGSGSGSLQK